MKWHKDLTPQADEDQARQLLKALRLRPCGARARVLACLIKWPMGSDWTACELHREILCMGTSVSLSAVYGSMHSFERHGLVEASVQVPGAYRLRPTVFAMSRKLAAAADASADVPETACG